MRIVKIFSRLWKLSKFSFIVRMEFEPCQTSVAVRCQTSVSWCFSTLTLAIFLVFFFRQLQWNFADVTLYLFILFFLLFLFYLLINLFKTVTVKRKNCDTRIMVDFGRLNLPKKTSWTSLVATKFQKKLLRKLSLTSNNN